MIPSCTSPPSTELLADHDELGGRRSTPRPHRAPPAQSTPPPARGHQPSDPTVAGIARHRFASRPTDTSRHLPAPAASDTVAEDTRHKYVARHARPIGACSPPPATPPTHSARR